MTISTYRAATALALALLAGGACSNGPMNSGRNGGSGAGNGGGGSGGSGTPATKGSCDDPQLEIVFSPMYSAYDGMHTFKIPAVADNMAAGSVEWSADDPSFVDIQPNAVPGLPGGAMITTRKAGSVKIIAKAAGLCGVSVLTIAQASPDDWTVGSKRYNEGIVIMGPLRNRIDGGTNNAEAACTNCHGDTATMGPFKTVSHTPQQTGGFSDEDLISIFTMGTVPMGGYFDSTIVPYDRWQTFHRWEMTPEQAKGMITYLRSLIPQGQTGMRGDFGGRFGDGGRGFRGDGGRIRGDGGRNRGDGGGMGGMGGGMGGSGGGGGGELDASASD